PAANVMTTGTLTIPLMKKVGYKPEVAGAIEAVASTGGAFMPPIMGAGAFIMAGYLNIPYRSVAWAALLPSALYYLALLLSVDAQAVRNGLRGLTDDEISGIWSKVWRRMHMAIPVLFLVVAIIVEWSPNKSAFWASILCVVAAASMKSTRPDWKKVLTALHDGSRQAMSIAAACAAAGLIVGVIGMTGLGAKMATAVISLSGGSVFVALLLTMVAAIILGCGMPFTAVYIILAATLAQPLIKLGLPPLAAHMFMFIFSCVAGLTPPVALTAYAAAAVAGAEPNRTGFVAFRLSLSAFIIPFMFAISPSLLLQGSPAAVMQAVISATIGVACLVAALEGYLLWMWSPLARGLLGVAGIALIDPRLMTSLTGLGLIALAAVVQAGVRKSAKPALMAEEFSK
ncbi:MAG TPA: TRAP transporter fused permease subunit, partial [Symbiobacteriaceae bacterium]|nr:TRAP transporter fused permease subunit [Symbiobacteriaceae bacterium]